MFEIGHNAPGRLWIMPCPDGARLAGDIARYRAAGAEQIVSMLALDEAAFLGLEGEGAACAAAGLVFDQHSIPDFGLPEAEDFDALVERLAKALDAGKGIAVHCRAGIGRSGMVTAAILIAQGFDATQAMARVAQSRGVSIPDTVEQGSFVAEYERRLRPLI